ncbi:hypothetical protein F7725_021847 [Dissostichus mawsoni]|uniref:Microsomal glutathione S-transferase 1 n=1 Tax=Dissostichus mawsoni TaxID=36200 RepID=A0A7J5ZGF8_DISMA|nr:hypothetical protein F7725_021847 [Dissostichus mawsoni]
MQRLLRAAGVILRMLVEFRPVPAMPVSTALITHDRKSSSITIVYTASLCSNIQAEPDSRLEQLHTMKDPPPAQVDIPGTEATEVAFANEEDVARKPVEERKKLLRNHPDVERVRRCHQNDIETIIPFVLVGLLYALTGPVLSTALLHFRIFAALASATPSPTCSLCLSPAGVCPG